MYLNEEYRKIHSVYPFIGIIHSWPASEDMAAHKCVCVFVSVRCFYFLSCDIIGLNYINSKSTLHSKNFIDLKEFFTKLLLNTHKTVDVLLLVALLANFSWSSVMNFYMCACMFMLSFLFFFLTNIHIDISALFDRLTRGCRLSTLKKHYILIAF